MSTSKKERMPTTLPDIESNRSKMKLRKRSMGEKEHRVAKRRRQTSYVTWAESDEQEKASTPVVHTLKTGIAEDVPVEVLAAATLLLAPRLPQDIPQETLKWALNLVAEKNF